MLARLSTAETYDLRQRVLRPNQPREACFYPADSEAVHFGWKEEKILSIVTAHPEQHSLFPELGQWRIRGMATEPSKQGLGLGSKVLLALLDWGQIEGVPLFWCNAREGAIPFYLRHGFKVKSELFEIPGIGPHKVLKK